MTLNDLCPVALTSAIITLTASVLLNNLKVVVKDLLDPFQFAYRAKRTVDDAIFIIYIAVLYKCTFR